MRLLSQLFPLEKVSLISRLACRNVFVMIITLSDPAKVSGPRDL